MKSKYPIKYYVDRLLPAYIDPEDVEQEVALLKLEGKTPHRGIIAKQMLNAVPELHFSSWLPEQAKEVKPEIAPMSTDDYSKLINFLYSLSINISILHNFLDNPEDETALNTLLDELYKQNILSKEQWENSFSKAKTIRVLIFEKIIKRKRMSHLEILNYVSSFYVSKRPAEVVRISLKRLIKSKDIEEVNGIYSAFKD